MNRFIIAALCAAAALSAHAQEKINLSIATGPTGGVYYPLGGGLANLLTRVVPGLNATAEATAGSVANLEFLNAGKAEVVAQRRAVVVAAEQAAPIAGRATGARPRRTVVEDLEAAQHPACLHAAGAEGPVAGNPVTAGHAHRLAAPLHRRPGHPPHLLNRLARQRWLRNRIVAP